jgi:DNA polymerase III subunit beta
MDIVVSKHDLVRSLSRCQGVSDRKSTMPVLSNVLIETRDDGLRIAATDLNVAVSGTIPAEIKTSGAVALGARDLFERIKLMPEGDIEITTTEEATTTVRSVSSARRYTLHGLPADKFPSLPEPDGSAVVHELDPHALGSLIAGTHFSISTDDSRMHLNSALFEWEGDQVRMVTTDGHRLSKMEVRVSDQVGDTSMLIPLKGIQELRRLCDEATSGEEGVKLEMLQSGPNAFFRLPNLQFSVKLVDAQFPPYEKVIPEKTEHIVRASRVAMADALKAVAIAASDRTGGVRLTIEDHTIRFESESPESGAGFDEVAIEYDGPPVAIGLNARYLLDALGAMNTEDVNLGVSGELDPALLRPSAAEAKGDYMAVIMPMRI